MTPNKYIFQFILLLYAVLLLDLFIPIAQFGIVPRTQKGLIGLFTAPFLHGGIRHLVSNTLPLIVLLSVLHYFYPKKAIVVILFTTIVGGLLVWVFARNGNHIGASGLIYGLVAFLIVNGFLEKKGRLILVSMGTLVIYGGLIWGIFPSVKGHVSWEGHLFGALSGILISFLLKKRGAVI